MYRIGGPSTIVATGGIRWNALLQSLPVVLACLTVFAVTATYWSRQCTAEAASTQSRAYEVASIRPSAPDPSGAGRMAIAGDRFVATNLSVQQMVYMAYNISTPDLISNLPQWTHSARFDIQAKLESDTAHGTAHKTEVERSRMILRALLADRFQLESHYERRDRPVYVMVVGKHGPKVKQATAADRLEMSIQRGHIHLRAATMAPLVEGVSLMVGRPVVDKTGLTGLYNIDLECAPDELNGTSDAGPSIFTVLREQLGLRLVPGKSPINVLFIDRLELPSAN